MRFSCETVVLKEYDAIRTLLHPLSSQADNAFRNKSTEKSLCESFRPLLVSGSFPS